MTIRELQQNLPWGAHDYNAEFQARTDSQRDTEHALLHIHKATGKLAEIIEQLSHVPDPVAYADVHRAAIGKYLADLQICSARMANKWPGGLVDLQDALTARLAEKFTARS